MILHKDVLDQYKEYLAICRIREKKKLTFVCFVFMVGHCIRRAILFISHAELVQKILLTPFTVEKPGLGRVNH